MTPDAVLSRVRETVARRRAAGANDALPQALLGFDEDELEGLAYRPWRRVLGSRSEIDVRDLLEAPKETVIRRCYRLLLIRDPNVSEADRWERALERGWTPVVLVAFLRWSAEGRSAGVPVRGVALRLPAGLGMSLVRRMLAAAGKAP